MDGDHHRGFKLNPILIGLLGILCGAIAVAAFHCIAVGCRRATSAPRPSRHQISENAQETGRTTRTIAVPVCRYSKEYCSEEICSVCLSEFNEGEQIRVLSECLHLFHVACIDMWLNSQSNCPLCRATTVPSQHVVVLMPESGGIPPRDFHQVPDSGAG
ncbi:RING-H2 finger protein ATL51 [Ricinus communis]|uniref:RING-type domain-containing protein n=1 Tax=Ricinus communis TaxID=3988 RepID=B9SP12_RICCO|nr:RING-H2 finger protein ATL51 [Ricinus communis]EEF34644.1 conserved hypothetical protein [Ricinus communis]|eukprot:XP_002527731.1 RING-H2 finger protein ATL51 [Ricinus communis]